MDWGTIQGRLVWARENAGLTRSEAAERTGIRLKTLSAHEEGRNLLRGLSTMYSSRYARAYGVAEVWLTAGAGAPKPSSRGDSIPVPVRGILQAGVWRESFELPPPDQFEVWIPRRPEIEFEPLYAGIVRGESMNRVYPDGTIVVMRRRIEDPRDLIPEKRYHVERQRPDGSVECTLKTVKRRADGSIWLVPESTDPAFQETIAVSSPTDGHVSFVGRVVQAIIAE